jgi:hypothetical protein
VAFSSSMSGAGRRLLCLMWSRVSRVTYLPQLVNRLGAHCLHNEFWPVGKYHSFLTMMSGLAAEPLWPALYTDQTIPSPSPSRQLR